MSVRVPGLSEEQVRAVIRAQAQAAAGARRRSDRTCQLPGCNAPITNATSRRRYCTPAHRAKAARMRGAGSERNSES